MKKQPPSRFSKIIFLLYTFLFSITIYAQVGIGTTTPTAMLDIVSTNTGIPAFKITPQSDPIGSTTGQLAVIDDLLYMYDATRGKWLSVESTSLQFGKNGSGDGVFMRFGGDVRNSGSGALMPYNGTITAITIKAKTGESSKEFQLKINGDTDTSFYLSSLEFRQTTTDIDFISGDYINLKIASSGDAVEHATAIIWMKWRK
mgnify:CR=1 FL=1